MLDRQLTNSLLAAIRDGVKKHLYRMTELICILNTLKNYKAWLKFARKQNICLLYKGEYTNTLAFQDSKPFQCI